MADVIRIDQVPARRRPTAERARRTPDRPVELPVHREAERAAPRTARREEPATVAAVARGLTELELAARFFPLVLLVVAADLTTKAWAVAALAERTVSLGPWLSLSLAFNGASAGGVSLGEHTRALNFTATGVVVGFVVMLVPALARVDRGAWRALALIAGAGLGNLVSLLRGGAGVPDFLALHVGDGAWVLNVADVALAVGLSLLARTVVVLARAARAESRRGAAARRAGGRPALR
jgi:lipoprotein signal peptidase